MAVVYALLSALAFGTGDFLGGLSSKRVSSLIVSLVSQLAGLVVVTSVLLVVAGNAIPPVATLVWGAAAGVGLGMGFLWYYHGLSIGQMGVVATDTAVWAALVPVVAGFITGERPSLLADLGIVVVIVAIGLVAPGSRTTDGAIGPARTLNRLVGLFHGVGRLHGVLAGISYGFFFIFLGRAQVGHPLWPLGVAILVSLLILAGAILVSRPVLELRSLRLPVLSLIGIIQAAGQLSFILATRSGLLALVAVLAALSPVPTAVLARFVLSQTLSRRQVIGVAVALAGISLITLGS